MPLADLILASTSPKRQQLLARANLMFRTIPPRVDEDVAKASLIAEGATPRDIADALAEMKARRVAEKHPAAVVIGSDQVLDFGGTVFSKPVDAIDAKAQLSQLQGQAHTLYSAVVLYENARPVWRHIGQARMVMRVLSQGFITDYVDQNWQSVEGSVGAYKIEEQGLVLFSAIEGEQTTIQGLPMPPLIGYLAQRGFIPS
jgi:septum formation protein